MSDYAVALASDINTRPTRGWLADGRAVVQASWTELEADDNVIEYELVAECERDDCGAMRCEGAHDVSWVCVAEVAS